MLRISNAWCFHRTRRKNHEGNKPRIICYNDVTYAYRDGTKIPKTNNNKIPKKDKGKPKPKQQQQNRGKKKREKKCGG